MKGGRDLLILILALFLVGCAAQTGGTETGNATAGTVGYAVADSLDTLSGLLTSQSEAGIALQRWQKPKPFWKQPWHWISPVYAATPECPVSITCSDTEHTASLITDFGSGCEVGEGIVVTGKKYLSWFNMGENSCPSSANPPLVFQALQGEGAKQIRSTDIIDQDADCGNPQNPVILHFDNGQELQITECGVLAYSNFQDSKDFISFREELNIMIARRVRFLPDGSPLYDHTLSTTSPLLIDIVKSHSEAESHKTIHSGKIQVSHNLAGFTVETEYLEIQYDYNQCPCYPISGSVRITVTQNNSGEILGTGAATFSRQGNENCADIQAQYRGSNLTLPLNQCRGI